MARCAVVVWEIAGEYSSRKTRGSILYANYIDAIDFDFTLGDYGSCEEIVEMNWK